MTHSNDLLETYALHLDNREAAYYAQIPGVIYHCTYITIEQRKDSEHYGKRVRKKVGPHALALYGAIRQIAGTNSVSYANTDTLAEMIGCSAGKVSQAKKELTQEIEQLNGKTLLQVKSKSKRKKDGGCSPYHEIIPTFIWPENNAYMATKKHQEKLPLGPIDDESFEQSTVSLSYCEDENASLSQYERQPPGSPSQYETNKNPLKNNPSVEETEPNGSTVTVCLSPMEESVSDCLSINEQHLKLMEYATTCLKNLGCDDNFIKEMRKYPPQKIIDAGRYCQSQSKKTIILNKFGYLRNAIEHGRKREE